MSFKLVVPLLALLVACRTEPVQAPEPAPPPTEVYLKDIRDLLAAKK